MKTDTIIIRGARQHNLKNIDVDLPRNKLIVITGLSGSGKSTLAFDTLYAEGQRRYVESLSTYARQFLERMEKPEVDLIEGLSPAIAIEQKTSSRNPRSTVGTVTEIYDYLRLLFARAGTIHCYQCGNPINRKTIDQIVDEIFSRPEGSRLIIFSPVSEKDREDEKRLLFRLRKDGFARVRIDGRIMAIESAGGACSKKTRQIDVVVDRLVLKSTIRNRLADSLELAAAQSGGITTIDFVGKNQEDTLETIIFNERPACTSCNISYPELTPAGFSFNSPQGACPQCNGLGYMKKFSPEMIVPNPDLSIRDGAVLLWKNKTSVYFAEFIDALTTHYGVDIYTPYKDLPESFKTVLMYGSGKRKIPFYHEINDKIKVDNEPFEGIINILERRLENSTSSQAREELSGYQTVESCPGCHGSKLKKESRAVKIDGLAIHQVSALTIQDALDFFSRYNPRGQKGTIAKKILQEISDRLGFLIKVGLSYLTLDRSANTLSGGESQRIRLATQIGSKLTGILYVLDEPSIGLHQRDNQKLLSALKKMRDLGNTVLVVEHDEETILAADHVVDMGPGAGMKGGNVVFSGPPELMLEDKHSLTGKYITGKLKIELPENRRVPDKNIIIIKGAHENNLKMIDVAFPTGVFTCVTGVSGSGKSSLVIETLFRSVSRKLNHLNISSGGHLDISGLEHIDKVVNIDQSPIGKTPRSNPGTYTGVFTFIRDLFSKTPEARMRGYKPGRFSFNVKGGRCEACRGDGILKIEMHFLPDVYVPCDICRGNKYNRETLEIRYKGKNISEVMDMTVNQALLFFRNMTNIRSKLQTLVDVGLGYIHIGQSATTLSGGEAQRVKLARELSRKGTGKTLYILDEPTTGLHADDIKKLLYVLNRLVDGGNTVIVIEHNLDVIKTADHIIDLGPEGGDKGGHIVGYGTPEAIMSNPDSHTGKALKTVLQSSHSFN